MADYTNIIAIQILADDQASAVVTASTANVQEQQAAVAAAAEDSAARQEASFVSLGADADEYAANMAIISREIGEAYGGITIAAVDSSTEVTDATSAVIVSQDELVAEMEVSNATILALYKARTAAAAESAAGQTEANDAASGLGAGIAKGAGLAGALSNPYLIAGAAISAASYEAVKATANFQTGLTKLYNTAGETMPLKELQSAIEGVAESTGQSLGNLTQALYHISSTGYDAAGGITILKAASEGAQEEGADLTTVANTLVGVMHDWGAGAGEATSYMDQLIKATSLGNMTLQDLTTALPTVNQVAQKAGLSFAQVAGALATITDNSTSANEAADQLRSLITGIITPTADASKQLQDFGLNVVGLQQNLGSEGLTGTLDEVMEAVAKNTQGGKTFINTLQSAQVASQNMAREVAAMPAPLKSLAQQLEDGKISFADYRTEVQALPEGMTNLGKQFETTYNAANSFNNLLTSGTTPAVQTVIGVLKELFPNINATQAVLALTGANAGTAASNVNKVAEAGDTASKSVTGWADQQKTLNTQFEIMKSDVEVLGTRVGQDLTPIVTDFFEGVGKEAKLATDEVGWMGDAFDAIGSAGGAIGKGIGDIGGAAGGIWDELFGSDDTNTKIETRAEAVADLSKATLAYNQAIANSNAAAKQQITASQQVANAQDTVQTAENSVTAALDKYGANSPQYIKAKQDLSNTSANLQQMLAKEVTANLTVMSSAYNAEQAQSKFGLALDTVAGMGPAIQTQLEGIAGKVASIGVNAKNDMVPISNLQGGINGLSTSWEGFSNSIQSQNVAVNQILMESGKELTTLQGQSTKLDGSIQSTISSISALTNGGKGTGITVKGSLTGGSTGINISGAFAGGTTFAPGGLALVGENGPELVDLPTGSQVYNTPQTQQILNNDANHVQGVSGAGAGGGTVNLTVNVGNYMGSATDQQNLAKSMWQALQNIARQHGAASLLPNIGILPQ